MILWIQFVYIDVFLVNKRGREVLCTKDRCSTRGWGGTLFRDNGWILGILFIYFYFVDFIQLFVKLKMMWWVWGVRLSLLLKWMVRVKYCSPPPALHPPFFSQNILYSLSRCNPEAPERIFSIIPTSLYRQEYIRLTFYGLRVSSFKNLFIPLFVRPPLNCNITIYIAI